jgi:hypothetical protein
MSAEPTLESSEIQETPISLPFPAAWWVRILYGLFVTAIPAFSFSIIHALEPEWQNGELSSYVILSLYPEASVFFILLLIYSIVSYWFLLIQPVQYSRSFIVRFGIYMGMILALQYSITLLAYAFDSSAIILVLVWIFPIVISWIYRLASRKWDERYVKWVFISLAVATFLIGTIAFIQAFPFWILVGLVAAGPFWSLLLAIQAAIWLLKNHETKFTFYHGLGLAVWLGTYIAAWRFDILKMFELYAALPPQPPPDCYIATAAAQGHPQFVRSHMIHRVDGKSVQVNGQLQVLKCAELTLLAINPRLHTVLRRIYDVVGKPLARKIQNPFMADIAYLALKPGEWLARLILKILIPNIDLIAKEIYIRQ